MAGLVIGGFKGLLAYRPRIDRARIERSGMTVSRAFPLAFALAVLALWPAAAQFGGMAGEAFNAPQAPRPACQQLLGTRDEVAKHGQALQAAGRKKAPPEEICKLFKAFLSAESKMLKGLEEHRATCGVPPETIRQVEAGHSKASQMGKQICELARRLVPGPDCFAGGQDCDVGTRPASAPECFPGKRGRPPCVVVAED
jgi:hypothetical protein